MSTNRRKKLGVKFRTAGGSGKKLHIMFRNGNWVLFKEGAGRVLSQFTTKQSALRNGQRILNSPEIEALVVHKEDGSVEKYQLSK